MARILALNLDWREFNKQQFRSCYAYTGDLFSRLTAGELVLFKNVLVGLLFLPIMAWSQSMTWAVSDAHRMPYFDGHGNGYLEVLGERLRQQGWHIEIRQLPRTRVEPALLNFTVDAIAITNPKWVANSQALAFSQSFADQPMNLVTAKEVLLTSLAQLSQMRVIEFAGYRYTPAFDNAARLSTVDIYRPEQGYQMLLSDRADVLVVDGWVFDYAQSQQPTLARLHKSDLLVSVDAMHFGVATGHPQQQELIRALNQAIAEFDLIDWKQTSSAALPIPQ